MQPKPTDPPARTLRAIKSQKYLPHSFLDPDTASPHESQINNRFSQLRKLTQEKDQLMSELHSLKQDAFSALQEKEEVVDRLRHETIRHVYFEDEKEEMQRELNRYRRKCKEISEEKFQINEKYEKQRMFFFEELYNKEAIIDELSSRIANLQVELDNNIDQNKKLNQQLFESETSTENMRSQIDQLKQEILEYYNKTEDKGHNFNIEHYICYRCLQGNSPSPSRKSKDKSANVEEVREQYEEEIKDLVNYYENQISIVRTMCQKQIGEGNGAGIRKTLQTQICSDYEENESVYELYSHGRSQNSIGLRSLHNLKNELRHMKPSEIGDEDKSQFTSNYFSYQHRPEPGPKESLESTKNIHIPEELAIKEEEKGAEEVEEVESSKWMVSRREIMWGLAGGTIGVIAALAISKLGRSHQG